MSYLLSDLDLMRQILLRCQRSIQEGYSESAWNWYAVFCEAWNRLGKSRLSTLDEYENLRLLIRETQSELQEMKQNWKR